MTPKMLAGIQLRFAEYNVVWNDSTKKLTFTLKDPNVRIH
jgi:hypothetical protein